MEATSNGMRKRQNLSENIRLLAAQRQLYRDCKAIDFMVVLFSVVIPFLCSVVLSFSFNNIINAIAGILIIAGIGIGIFTQRQKKQYKKKLLEYKCYLTWKSINFLGILSCLELKKI